MSDILSLCEYASVISGAANYMDNTTAKKSPRTVVTKKSTVTPQSVNKVTQIEAVKVTETPVANVEKKVTRSLTQLDGFELILLPLLYLEDFAKRLINNQF